MIVGDEVAELRGVAVETQHHVVDRAVTLFCHDDLGLSVGLLAKVLPTIVAIAELLDALVRPLHRLRAMKVVILAEDKHDDIGILLDGAGLTQIAEQRPLVLALLDRSRELRQRQDGHVELLSERLETAGDLGNLLDAALCSGALARSV